MSSVLKKADKLNLSLSIVQIGSSYSVNLSKLDSV